MAFDQSTFGPIGGENMLTPTIWGYTTLDTLAVVSASGYFDEKIFQIASGDQVFISAFDGVASGYFSNSGSAITTTLLDSSANVAPTNVYTINSVDDFPNAPIGGVIELTNGDEVTYQLASDVIDIGANRF